MNAEIRRRKELAAIHLGKHQLGMDDSAYRDLLWSVARRRSSKDLDEVGRQAVIERMRRLGFERAPSAREVPEGRKPSVPLDRLPMINKIQALLAAHGKPWTYASAIAKRMFNIDQLEWATAEQLRALIAALSTYDRRHGQRPTSRPTSPSDQ